ncbi:hypothetical protein MATL_G00256900 [Megalops atlanticus]|uniref:NFX1-type zinc finger-containing protein 1 n=1 Tax=Megalops atlanticus TaxID=7932 RepID=A0A9D3PBL9_MEGAT|nr:hypothetical protein MATL_G00256900 [Megalops atlanticus]
MSGRGGQHRVRPPQQQGHGRPARRESQGTDERVGNSARGGHSHNRRGGHRSQSHSREAEAGGRPPWRRDHSAGRAPFQHCPPLLSDALTTWDLTSSNSPGGGPFHERRRQDRPANPYAQNSRRGNPHSSQGRILNHSVRTTGDSAAGVQRPPANHRPPSRTGNHNTKKNERGSQGSQLQRSHRARSQPNLSDLGCQSQDHHRRARISQESQDPKPKASHRLDFRSLEKILQMEPSEVVMKLAAPGSGLQELLDRKETTDNLTSLTLDVLSKACGSRTNRQNLQHLLAVVKDSQFLKGNIPMFLMMLGTKVDQESRQQTLAKLGQIVDLYVSLMSVFPSSTIIDVSLAVVLLEREFTNLQVAGVRGLEEVQESLGRLQRMVSHLQEKKREGTLRSDAYTFLLGAQDELDVESFRHMSVFPTYEDIHATERPFLRPNVIGESFRDCDTYLDTHFRLLREDFVKPLRDGISHLLHFDGKDLRRGRLDDIRIYFDAHIVAPLCTPKGILYRVQFDNQNLKMVNWESSKRLLYGALVCLSIDNFETMIFATVANRDVRELKVGVTTLFFTEENRMKLADVSPSDTFLMVETTAFFEAYRHVLEGLQEMRAEDLPMQRYIVSCDDSISPPGYLLAHRHEYSLQALMNDKPLKVTESSRETLQRRFDMLRKMRQRIMGRDSDPEVKEGTEPKETVGDILNFSEWPSKEKLNLDESQMKAVQLALTKELAIIQGPPGTGKTYVGLKIVKALLDNDHIWQSGGSSPILVVCYTNHALDQFLEGILKFMKKSSGLVRVGGRSSSEKLKELSLSSRRRGSNFRQNLAGHLRAMFAQLNDARKTMEESIGKRAALFESSAQGILHENVLEQYIQALHGTTLEEGLPSGFGGYHHRKRGRSLMLEWLGVSMLSHASRQMEIIVDTEEHREDWMSVASDVMRDPEEEDVERFTPDTAGHEDFGDVDLYQSEDEEVEHNSGDVAEDLGDHTSSGGDSDLTSTDVLTTATEVLSLAEPQRDEDAASEVGSVTTDGDGDADAEDLLQVAEEAELVQAERMMEGDDVQRHIQSARRRLAQTQRVVLAYVPEQEEKEERGEKRGDPTTMGGR